MSVRRGREALLAALLCVLPGAAAGQWDVAAYALGVGLRAGSGTFGPGGTTWLARTRVMPSGAAGPLRLEVAYEHVLTRTPAEGAPTMVPGSADVRGGDWLGTDWEIRSTERTSWRHRFDRLSLEWGGEQASVTVGRQVISWATTLFLTPSDPFVPFDPSDPFREYRAGVDAVRVRLFPGPFTEIEAVARAAETPDGTTVTALVRGQTALDAWAVGGWAGALHGEAAGALFATGAVGATAVRGELSLRRGDDDSPALRGAVGIDRRFSAAGRDLFLVAEMQYDGFGARRASDLRAVALSDPYRRGEMQTLGRWTGAAQASFQVHPLVSLDGMVLASLGDGSALLAPGVSWSATSAAAVRLGAYVGAGPGGADPVAGLASEYGPIPGLAYLAVSWFF
ncbi:MAG: hypothetical protein AMXMBFR53_05460 [Gemmatimonadota bacterium]